MLREHPTAMMKQQDHPRMIEMDHLQWDTVTRDIPLWTLETEAVLRRNSWRVTVSQRQQAQRIKGFSWDSRVLEKLSKDSEDTRDSRAKAHKGYTGLRRTSVKIRGTKEMLYKLRMRHHGSVKNVKEQWVIGTMWSVLTCMEPVPYKVRHYIQMSELPPLS